MSLRKNMVTGSVIKALGEPINEALVSHSTARTAIVQEAGAPTYCVPADALSLHGEAYHKTEGKVATIHTMLSLGITREEYYALINSVPVEGNIIPTRDVQKVIKKLALNNMLVALTNTPYDATIKTLRYLEVLPYFKKIYTIDKYDYIKPSTKNFKQILTEHNFQPHLSLSIGDSVEKDLTQIIGRIERK